MGGVPCIARTRIPVATVVGLVSDGMAPEAIIAEYPQLTLDPIDGTANLIHGLPLCGVSLALVRDGIPILGIDLPFLSNRYAAAAGEGA